MKRIPYGVSDFKQIRREGLYYVDKTMFLPVMEDEGHFLFFVRPRRFGKSLFLNMMRAYYDMNERDSFGQLFDGLWIADHPTQEMGQYQVLHLDFSRVVGGDLHHLEDDFGEYCNVMLDDFVRRYAKYYGDDYLKNAAAIKRYPAKFSYIDNEAKTAGYPLYLIVDEYDNFTNAVLNEQGENVYHALTHGEGFYRDVFKLFKGMFSRILMMGVSPVTMDDVTSGYNIASNMTMKPQFNQMLGFSETNVREMIAYYQQEGKILADPEVLVQEMKPWYDNYCFAKEVAGTDPKMFNSDMVLYFLKNVIQTGRPPERMTDINTRTDYSKMRRLLQLDKLDGNRRGVLYEIAQNDGIETVIVESFPAARMADADNFVSLLFYYGMLTIGGTFGNKQKLVVPNNNVRKQYYGYLMEEYQTIAQVDIAGLSKSFDDAAINGNWQPMVRVIAGAYARTTSIRQLIEGERNLQGFMNAYLTLNPYYLTAPEMEMGHGYCDFFLMPDLQRYPMVAHSYILELKYLKKDASASEAAEQWRQAVDQIRRYAKSEAVNRMTAHTHLHLLVLQIQGFDLIRCEEVAAGE